MAMLMYIYIYTVYIYCIYTVSVQCEVLPFYINRNEVLGKRWVNQAMLFISQRTASIPCLITFRVIHGKLYSIFISQKFSNFTLLICNCFYSYSDNKYFLLLSNIFLNRWTHFIQLKPHTYKRCIKKHITLFVFTIWF